MPSNRRCGSCTAPLQNVFLVSRSGGKWHGFLLADAYTYTNPRNARIRRASPSTACCSIRCRCHRDLQKPQSKRRIKTIKNRCRAGNHFPGQSKDYTRHLESAHVDSRNKASLVYWRSTKAKAQKISDRVPSSLACVLPRPSRKLLELNRLSSWPPGLDFRPQPWAADSSADERSDWGWIASRLEAR